MSQPVALLVAHGSPDPRHAAALESLAENARACTDRTVHLAFLEHNEPTVSQLTPSLSGGSALRLIPVLLTHAYHRGVDIPQIAADLEAVGHQVWTAPPLGLEPEIVAAVIEAAKLGGRDLTDLPENSQVIAALTGSRQQAALDEIARAWNDPQWPSANWSVVALSDAGGVRAAIDRARDLGRDPLVVAASVAPGILQDRILEQAARAQVPALATNLSHTRSMGDLIARFASR